MSTHHAPQAAMWFADRFISGARRDSLVGDLVEQFDTGKSTVWFWRQVLAAIVTSAAADRASHKLLAARALIVGATLYYVLAIPVIWIAPFAQTWIGNTFFLDIGPGAWRAFWINQFSVEPVIYLACFITGWLGVRLHRTHGVAIGILLAAFIFVLENTMMIWMLMRDPHPPSVTITGWRVIAHAMSGLGRPLSVLVGGLCASTPRTTSLTPQVPR